jgi:hypothetical protein
MKKQCFKCGKIKLLDLFYVHKQMGDGHLNKCKDCTKKEATENRNKKITYYREYDRKRHKKGYIKPIKQKSSKENTYKTWNGSSLEYRKLHQWVERNLGKPDECTECRNVGLVGHKIHWANISGEYKKDITDWVRLCAWCHRKFDLKKQYETDL